MMMMRLQQDNYNISFMQTQPRSHSRKRNLNIQLSPIDHRLLAAKQSPVPQEFNAMQMPSVQTQSIDSNDRGGEQAFQMGGVKTLQLLADQLKLNRLSQINTPDSLLLDFKGQSFTLRKVKWSAEKKRLV